jgi:hypothetical protein
MTTTTPYTCQMTNEPLTEPLVPLIEKQGSLYQAPNCVVGLNAACKAIAEGVLQNCESSIIEIPTLNLKRVSMFIRSDAMEKSRVVKEQKIETTTQKMTYVKLRNCANLSDIQEVAFEEEKIYGFGQMIHLHGSQDQFEVLDSKVETMRLTRTFERVCLMMPTDQGGEEIKELSKKKINEFVEKLERENKPGLMTTRKETTETSFEEEKNRILKSEMFWAAGGQLHQSQGEESPKLFSESDQLKNRIITALAQSYALHGCVTVEHALNLLKSDHEQIAFPTLDLSEEESSFWKERKLEIGIFMGILGAFTIYAYTSGFFKWAITPFIETTERCIRYLSSSFKWDQTQIEGTRFSRAPFL